jgi:hypothetical protein
MENQEAVANTFKMLHVQVLGEPTQDELLLVANEFANAVQTGTQPAVVTNTKVQTHLEWTTGEKPVDLVYVRQAMTPSQVAEIAYNITGQNPEWDALSAENQQGWISYAVDYFNVGGAADKEDPSFTIFDRVLKNLTSFLVRPASNLQAHIWTGSVNLAEDAAWITIPFQSIPPKTIFKLDAHPGRFFISVNPAVISYSADGARWNVDSAEAVVSGTQPIDASDLTKGFTLTWKLAEAQPASEEEKVDLDSVSAGIGDPEDIDNQALSAEQDPNVVTDVEAK